MNSSIHRITLDVAEAASHSAVTLRQGENAHRLEISFTDNGRPYSLSGECYAVFAARKSDGTQLLNACTIVNNTVIYDLTAQTTAAPGRLSCEVRLYGETNKLIIAPKFSLFVEDSAIDEEGIESTDEFSALNDLLSRAATVSVFKIKGYFESAEALEDIASPAVGDTYGIGTQPPYEIYTWDAVNGEWVNHGTLQGEPGEPGQDGQDGAPGQPGQTGPQGEPGVSGVYVGGGTAPEAYNVQIDPNGSADELVTEAPKDNKQYARQNGEWTEVTEENIVAALGYTPADEEELDAKADTSAVLPKPATGLAVGKYFRVATYDSATGAITLEAVDDPAAVKGVQVAGTDLTPDTDGYVNIPTASSSGAGVVITSNTYGVTTSGTGYISAQNRSLEQYNSAGNYMFIGKGTLENIKTDIVKRALAALDAAGRAEVIASIGITVDSNGICHFGS